MKRRKSRKLIRAHSRHVVESLEARCLLSSVILGQQPGAQNNTQFHGNAARTGFDQTETFLTPSNVASSFGQIWESPVLDGHVYATPLFLDSLSISGGVAGSAGGNGIQSASYVGKSLGIVFAATGGGSVYAIAAQDTNGTSGIAPGTIVWEEHLGNAYSGIDGNSIGVLSTPIIDLKSGRMYVTGSVTFSGQSDFWVFALSLHDGSIISATPYTQAILDSLNQNQANGPGVAVPFSEGGADQRGALNLSADGSTLYVDYACYGASNPGWMTTVATGVTNGAPNGQTFSIVSAFASVDTTAVNANGGQWGAGGPAIDAAGNVFVGTGDTPGGTGNPAGDWANSLLEFGPGQTLQLTGVYTPWNYPTQDTIDSDVGGSSPIVVTLPNGSSTTTDLVSIGGKQGNGYLADGGNHLNNPTRNPNNSPASYPASLIQRPPEGEAPDQDASLYDTTPTGTRTYWIAPNAPQDGPLALFLPYNESSASGDTAKARDTPATFTDSSGNQYIIFAGTTKAGVGSTTPVAPSLIVTKVVHSAGQPAYLQVVSSNNTVMSNPGANLITANGTSNEIDWVVDSGVLRTSGLTNFSNGDPVLYAYNVNNGGMTPIWSSAYQQLDMGGKYNSIAVARGNVFLGTDRIQAFGLTSDTIVDDSYTAGQNSFSAGPPPWTYVGSGWTHITGSSTFGTFDGTVSTDNKQGDYAALTFTGSQIQIFANETSSYGTDTIQLDGNTQTENISANPTSPNGDGEGDILIDTISGLSAGTHTLKILNNSSGNTISIDRVEITPPTGTPAELGVSVTDGNAIPSGAGSVISYTVNWNNAGSAAYINNAATHVSATGTNATNVVVTDTVPANTTADLANSTAGWTLQTAGAGGPGSAGSTYTFAVGALNAGVTGSAVFSVDLNSNIPAGTTSATDVVSISDSAGDTAIGNRTTPVPPSAEVALIFSQEPPTNSGAGLTLNPPVEVSIQDQFQDNYTNDNSTVVTLALSAGTFVGGGTTATAMVSNGVATFSNLQITSAGMYTLSASAAGLTSTISSPFTVAATAKLGVIQQPPATASAGVAISPAVTVAVENQSGTTVTTDSSTITLKISSGSFANGSTTATAQAQNGVATFSNLVIDTTGSYTLTATDGALVSAQTNSFNVAATATQLAVTTQPNNTILGEAVNPSVAVSLEDQFGNVATGNTSNVTLTLNSGTFFGGSSTVTAAAVNGVAVFNDLVLAATGTYTLAATGTGVTSTTSHSFTISADGAHTLTTIDDNNSNNTGQTPQVVYSTVAHWVQSPTSLPNNFDGTITTDSTNGDTATVVFTGTLITLYAALSTTAGSSADLFLDGNYEGNVNLQAATAAIAPVFTSPLLTSPTSPGLAPGTHTFVVKVTGGNVSIDKFVVGPATPALAWANPVAISYGTALTGTQLDAFPTDIAGFPGNFVYNPALTVVLGAGANQTLSTTFTPTDTTDYLAASAQQSLTVLKSTPTITWNGPDTDLSFGQGLSAAQLNATATLNSTTVPGSFVYTPALGFVPPAGQNYPLSLTFTPNDTADYNSVTAVNNVDVDPATPIINWPTPADIADGTPLSATQLDAAITGTNTSPGTTIPGTFTYNPAIGAVLPAGQHQALGVSFTPTNTTDYSVVGQTDYINVDYGPSSKLGFVQQPISVNSGVAVPPVTVAVEDSAGSTITTAGDTITLTLSSGMFVGGATTATATAVNGVATFSNLVLANNGVYSFTATDGTLTDAVSNQFGVGTSIYVNFNNGATDLSSNFAQNNAGTPGGTDFTWTGGSGVNDASDGTAAGGGVLLTGTADQSSIYTPSTINLSDGNVHTISEFVRAATGPASSDKILQIGFVTTPTSGFNGGFSFLSARVYGNYRSEFQSGNGAGTTAAAIDTTSAPGGVHSGDWLQLILTTQETASGSFQGTFSLEDYGPNGTGTPTTITAPVSYTVTGLTTIGTGATMNAGWRTDVGNAGSPSLEYDNFAVDQPPAHLAYLSQPAMTESGVPFNAPFVVAVQDINSNIVAGDSSTVILTLNHGTFSNGSTNVTAAAVNGIATFTGLTIDAIGPYILIAKDSDASLDLAFAPVTVTGATQLGFVQGPSNASIGAAMSPPVMVAAEDAGGTPVAGDTSAVVLTLNTGTFANTGTNMMTVAAVGGVATFTGMVINALGSYTLTATDGTLPSITSGSFSVTAGGPSELAFTQQPVNTAAGASMTPAVEVAVESAAGTVIGGNTSTVTLTLSSGTFASGGSTITAAASAGVATFNNLVINSPGAYTVTASDGSLTNATSNQFAIITSATQPIFDSFNNGASDLTSKFSVAAYAPTNSTSNLSWASTAGIADQAGQTAGGGLTSSSPGTDLSAVYTPSTVNLSDGAVHTISQYVTWSSSLSSIDRALQLGFLAPGTTAFNGGNGGNEAFISARVIGNSSAEIQTATGGTTSTIDNTTFTTPTNGDWLQLVLTVQETAPGSFNGIFSVLDYGPTAAVGSVSVASQPRVLVPAANYSVTGVTGLGTGAGVSPGFRIDTASAAESLDNFSVDPATTIPDDRTTGTGIDQVKYSSGWTNSSLTGAYDGTYTSVSNTSATATVTFTGTQIRYYAVKSASLGNASVSIDGFTPTTVSETSTTATGDVLVYASPVLTPGTHTLTISTTGTGTVGHGGGHNTGGGVSSISVDRFDIILATPSISWPSPAAITTGTALSSTQLDATANVPGTFVYSQPAGTILPAGQNQTLTAVFVPSDTSDYSTVGVSTQITVGASGLPPGVIPSNGAVYNYNSTADTLSLSSGTLTFTQDLGGAFGLTVTATGAGSSLVFPTDQHLAGITLTGGATATVQSVGGSRTHSNHNVLVIGTLGAASDPTISIDSANGSKLNMMDNDLVVHTGSSDTGGAMELPAVQALAAIGRNVAPGGVFDGTWNGNGLTSSSAASNDAAVGYEQNVLAVERLSDMFLGVPNNTWTVGSFSEPLGPNDVIAKYTYDGDLGLDGEVDGNAATIFSSFFNNGATMQKDYAYGDMNGDAKVNGNDATIFSSLFDYGQPVSGLPQL